MVSSSAPAPKSPGAFQARAISRLLTAILLGSLSFGILDFALTISARRLGASALDIGGAISVFAVIITVSRPLVGWGIDRWGRKWFLASSFVFYGMAMLLFGFARTMGMLYAARIVQGVGSSLLWIPAYTAITELSTHDWGRSVGTATMASARGATFGAFLGFTLTFAASTFVIGWQWAFELYAAAALIAALLVWRFVPETRKQPGAAADPDPTADHLDRKFLLRLMLIVFLTGASSSMISPLLMIFLQDRFTADVRTLGTAFIPAA
ncbi:MAG: MFS transporter, partial [Anaerolineae bacterium]